LKAAKIAACLRANDPAIMGRIRDNLFMIDLKAVRESEDNYLIQALNNLK